MPRFRASALRVVEAFPVRKLDCEIHVLFELAAVVSEGKPGLEWHGGRRDVVSSSQLGRIDPHLGGGQIDHALDHKGRFRAAIAAIGPHRICVAEYGGDVDVDDRRPINAGERPGIEHECGHRVLQVGADGSDRLYPQREEMALAIERKLGLR